MRHLWIIPKYSEDFPSPGQDLEILGPREERMRPGDYSDRSRVWRELIQIPTINWPGLPWKFMPITDRSRLGMTSVESGGIPLPQVSHLFAKAQLGEESLAGVGGAGSNLGANPRCVSAGVLVPADRRWSLKWLKSNHWKPTLVWQRQK
jgi:hypothetical protein